MGLPELTNKIKSKDISGVYFFYGDEEYTKDFQLRKIKSFVSASPSPEYADIIFDGASLTASELSYAVDTPAFLSEWKIIEINDFPVNQPKSIMADFVDVLSEIPSGVAVVFVYRSGNIDNSVFEKNKDGSNEFLSFIESSSICVNFETQTGDKMIQWIGRHFKSENAAIEQSAIEFLPEYCGNDMYLLVGEIDKLCSYYKDKPISIEDIKNLCCENSEYKLYDVVNCISQGNANRLKEVYEGLVYAKTAPEIILATVSNYFNDMLNVKTAMLQGIPASEAKRKLCLADWQYNRLFGAVKNLSEKFIANGIRECMSTDVIVKSHAADSYVIIEIMLYRIMMYGKQNS